MREIEAAKEKLEEIHRKRSDRQRTARNSKYAGTIEKLDASGKILPGLQMKGIAMEEEEPGKEYLDSIRS
jgi:hypothetical protein